MRVNATASPRREPTICLSCAVPASLMESIDELAFRSYRSRADIARQAVVEFLERQTEREAAGAGA